MRELSASHGEVARTRRPRLASWLLGALLVLSVALPASASAAGITFVAPPGARIYADQSEGPVGYTEELAFRTTDPRPTIGIQADGGSALQCHFDNVFVTEACGGPGPGCAVVCGSYQPTSPMGPDSNEFTRGHFLAVDLVDADGNTLSSMWVNIDVDTTPPVTTVDSAGGVLSSAQTGTTPVRPSFGFDVTDSNSVGTNIDSAACAWGPANTSPSFSPCRLASDGSGTFKPRLPARHQLYRLQVRGTDDFGRSTTATGVYDVVPCALSIHRPARIASLLASGITTTVSCDTTKHVAVAVYAFMVNGDRSTSPLGAVANNPILGEYKVSNKTQTFRVSRHLRLSAAARSALRGAHSIGLVLAAGVPDKVETGFTDGSLSYQSFILHG